MRVPTDIRLSKPLATIAIRTTRSYPGSARVAEIAILKVGPGREPELYRRPVDPEG